MLYEEDCEFVADYEAENDERVWPGDDVVRGAGCRWRVVRAVPVEIMAEFVERLSVSALVVEPYAPS
jgi:hypothetical protein